MKFLSCSFQFFKSNSFKPQRLTFDFIESTINGVAESLEDKDKYKEPIEALRWKLTTMDESTLAAESTDIKAITDKSRDEVRKKQEQGLDTKYSEQETVKALNIIDGYEKKYTRLQEGCRTGFRNREKSEEINTKLSAMAESDSGAMAEIMEMKNPSYEDLKKAELTIASVKAHKDQIPNDIATLQLCFKEVTQLNMEWGSLNIIKTTSQNILRYLHMTKAYQLVLPRYLLACQMKLTALQQKFGANKASTPEAEEKQNRQADQIERGASKILNAAKQDWEKAQETAPPESEDGKSGLPGQSKAFENAAATAPHTELKADPEPSNNAPNASLNKGNTNSNTAEGNISNISIG